MTSLDKPGWVAPNPLIIIGVKMNWKQRYETITNPSEIVVGSVYYCERVVDAPYYMIPLRIESDIIFWDFYKTEDCKQVFVEELNYTKETVPEKYPLRFIRNSK